jgi:hypothetical protein
MSSASEEISLSVPYRPQEIAASWGAACFRAATVTERNIMTAWSDRTQTCRGDV